MLFPDTAKGEEALQSSLPDRYNDYLALKSAMGAFVQAVEGTDANALSVPAVALCRSAEILTAQALMASLGNDDTVRFWGSKASNLVLDDEEEPDTIHETDPHRRISANIAGMAANTFAYTPPQYLFTSPVGARADDLTLFDPSAKFTVGWQPRVRVDLSDMTCSVDRGEDVEMNVCGKGSNKADRSICLAIERALKEEWNAMQTPKWKDDLKSFDTGSSILSQLDHKRSDLTRRFGIRLHSDELRARVEDKVAEAVASRSVGSEANAG